MLVPHAMKPQAYFIHHTVSIDFAFSRHIGRSRRWRTATSEELKSLFGPRSRRQRDMKLSFALPQRYG